MHIYKISHTLLCSVMSAQWVVCIIVKRALVATPNETNMLKYCNLFHRALFFNGSVLRDFFLLSENAIYSHESHAERLRET